MALVNGSDCLFQVNVLGEYLSIACARSFSITTVLEDVEVTTKGDGQWRSYAPSALTYTISLEGILKIDETQTSAFDIHAAQIGFTEVPFRIIFEDEEDNFKIVEGNCLVSSSTFTVNAGQFADFSIELKGTGALVKRTTVETCETVINDGLLQVQLRQFPYATPGATKLEVILSSISGAWERINYSIDGGSTGSSFSSTFYINPISLGTHTIRLAAVCPNGIEGTPLVKTFEFT